MTDRCKSCHSCGFPMERKEDYALANVNQLFCKHCTDEKGALLPFGTILEANVKYYISSQGIAREAALKMAKELLATMPAWKNKGAEYAD